MKRIAFSVVLVGVSAVAGFSISSGMADPTTVVRDADTAKLTDLRKERRDVLREAVLMTEESYRNGMTPFESVPRITVKLLNAELDLAADRAARITVRERMVEQCKAIEEQVKTAVATGKDLLEAKADRLEAEIDLIRETVDGQ